MREALSCLGQGLSSSFEINTTVRDPHFVHIVESDALDTHTLLRSFGAALSIKKVSGVIPHTCTLFSPEGTFPAAMLGILLHLVRFLAIHLKNNLFDDLFDMLYFCHAFWDCSQLESSFDQTRFDASNALRPSAHSLL